MQTAMSEKVLIVAYGNRDREDDGAGWHILNKLASYLELPTPQFPGDRVLSPSGRYELLYLFQLLPEMAEDLLDYAQIIFIDAHNSEQLPDLSFEPVGPSTRHSAFTHHMSPEELLEISRAISGQVLNAWLLSVRGYSFQFKEVLSPATEKLTEKAFFTLGEHLGLLKRPQTYEERELTVYRRGEGLNKRTRPVISEHLALLRVNGQDWLTFVCSPTELKDLARGFLWNAGVIESLTSIGSIIVSPDASLIDVRLNVTVRKPESFHRTATGIEPDSPLPDMGRVPDDFSISPKQLTALFTEFDSAQTMHELAGGFHAAALSDGESLKHMVEDLGRHNCVDKIAGWYLAQGKPFPPRILYLSGRISSEMVHKCLSMGVNIMVSRTTPTALAVQLAQRFGITILGYMRQNGFEIHSHPQRIQD